MGKFTYRVLEEAGKDGVKVAGKTYQPGQTLVAAPEEVAAVRGLLWKESPWPLTKDAAESSSSESEEGKE